MKKTKKRKPAKKRKTNIKAVIFSVFIILVTIVAITFIYAINYKPGVSDDGFDLNDMFDNETVQDDAMTPILEDDNPDPIETDKPPVIKAVNYKRTTDNMYTFLLAGKDNVALNTDIIMVVSFNTSTGEIAVMQIPRDTLIRMNGSRAKINTVYAAYYLNAYSNKADDPVKAGMEGLRDELQKNLSIKIDYYAFFLLDGFKNIIDIIGGVDVDVPFDMRYSDPEQNLYINLSKGLQTLDGEKSEQFVRFRKAYVQGDIGRVNAQKIFFTALIKQLKTKITLTKIPQLTSEVIKNVKTTLSVTDCVYFGKNALAMDMNNITMFTIPGDGYNAPSLSYYVIRRADTLALINKFFNVYDSDVTDSIFDINGNFNDASISGINSIYKTKQTSDINSLISSAEDIADNGVDIMLIK
jgi:LCP family protein required for cell wall assembly